MTRLRPWAVAVCLCQLLHVTHSPLYAGAQPNPDPNTLSLRKLEDERDADKISHVLKSLRERSPAGLKPLMIQIARALGRIHKPESVSPLLSLINESDLDVKTESIFSLGNLGFSKDLRKRLKESDIKDVLNKGLDSRDPEVRALSAEAIGKIALEESPSWIKRTASDPSPSVKREGLTALARYRLIQKNFDPTATVPPVPKNVLDAFLPLCEGQLKDESSEVRQAIGFMLSRNKDDRAPTCALSLALDPDQLVRYWGLATLTKTFKPETAKEHKEAAAQISLELLKGQKSHPSFITIEALSVLRAIGVPLDETAVALTLTSPYVAVRAGLAQNLAATSPHHKALERLAKDKSPNVRAALAAQAWYQSKAKADPSWIVREALAASGEKAAPEILVALLSDKSVLVRASALESLGNSPKALLQKEIVAKILKATESNELSERGSAFESLKSVKPFPLEASQRIYKNSLTLKWIELRESIIDFWISEKSEASLKMALSDPDPSIAKRARDGLNLPPLKNPSDETPSRPLKRSPYFGIKPRAQKLKLVTTKGSMTIEMFWEQAPTHVENILGYAKKGFYNGLPWHRVVPNFVIQGGDPDKSGWGSAPGFQLRAEINRMRFLRGTLGMPRSSGFDTGGIQLFITHLPMPHLDGQYTVMGQVTRGIEVLDKIEKGDLIISATPIL